MGAGFVPGRFPPDTFGRGRFIEQDNWKTAADLQAAPTCISFQPAIRAHAVKVKGAAYDFTGKEDLLLADI
jgi:hypothetical protein